MTCLRLVYLNMVVLGDFMKRVCALHGSGGLTASYLLVYGFMMYSNKRFYICGHKFN